MNAQQPQTRPRPVVVTKDTDWPSAPPNVTGTKQHRARKGRQPGRGRQACPFDELLDDFTRIDHQRSGVATVNHRDDLDDEAVSRGSGRDAVLASPC